MNTNAMLQHPESFRAPAPPASSGASSGALHAVPGAVAELCELFDASHGASAALFALGLVAQNDSSGPLLWIQDRQSAQRHGLPFFHGLPRGWQSRLVHVLARDARDALWAMEEGLKCAGISAVLGELSGTPRALDFTASRRLAVAAERHATPAFLIRHQGERTLSGARQRWTINARPSLPHPYAPQAPGVAVLAAELFRSRRGPPGVWDLAYDRKARYWTPDRGNLAAVAGDGAPSKTGSTRDGAQRGAA